MSLFSALALSALLVRVLSLSILPPLQSTAAELLPVALKEFEIDTPFAVNVSTVSGNPLKIQCDGSNFGKNLNVASCTKIFNYIDKRVPEKVFADRRTGIPADVLLPWRIYDNKGLCFVQPALKNGSVSGRATFAELGEAAYTLLQECVVKRGMGGIAAQIGGDNNVYVAIAKYHPRIRCDQSSPAPPWRSCYHIWGDMKASQQRQVFGIGSDPGIQVRLPYQLKAIDARCEMTIDMTGKPTIGTWYQIWEATLALGSVCMRGNRKGGRATGLGVSGNIEINMYDAAPDLAGSMANKTVGNSSLSTHDLGQPLANAASDGSSVLNTWSQSDARDFTMEAISDFVLEEPIEDSSDLEHGDSIFATLPGDKSTTNLQDATA